MQEDLFHRNLPARLDYLRDLPFAHYIGTTLAGVDWVAYCPENVEPMCQRFRHVVSQQRLGKAQWD